MPAEVLGQVCPRQLPARHTAKGSTLQTAVMRVTQNGAEETDKETQLHRILAPSLALATLGPRGQPSLGPLTSNFRIGLESPPRRVWADMGASGAAAGLLLEDKQPRGGTPPEHP